jgi:hypothetical protein
LPSIAARDHDKSIEIIVVDPDENAHQCRKILTKELGIPNRFRVMKDFEKTRKAYKKKRKMKDTFVIAIAPYLQEEDLLDFVISHNMSFLYVPGKNWPSKYEKMQLVKERLTYNSYSPTELVQITKSNHWIQAQSVFAHSR